jgi:hypothetical protein
MQPRNYSNTSQFGNTHSLRSYKTTYNCVLKERQTGIIVYLKIENNSLQIAKSLEYILNLKPVMCITAFKSVSLKNEVHPEN